MRSLRSAVAALLVLFAGAARAQSDFVGVRAMGMGEAMRATASGAEAPLLNPAAMSLNKGYVIEAQYGFRIEDLGHHVNVAIVDSVTARIAAGLFYTYIHTNPKVGFNWAGGKVPEGDVERQGHAAGLSLAMALGDRFMIGVNVKYLHLSTEASLPKGAVPSSITLDSVNGITFDVGLLVRLGDKFNITAVGYNLWDHGSRESPLSLGFGLAYVPMPILSINLDAVVNFTGYQNLDIDAKTGKSNLSNKTTVRLGPGVEFLAGHKVPIRAGVVYDSGVPGTYLTLGLGYLGSQFGVDLGYRTKVQGGVENFLMLGLRLFVD